MRLAQADGQHDFEKTHVVALVPTHRARTATVELAAVTFMSGCHERSSDSVRIVTDSAASAVAPSPDASPEPCQSPTIANGRCRMHGGPSPGAPKGYRNAWKHGRFAAEAIARRRHVADLLRRYVTPESHGDCWPLGTRTTVLMSAARWGAIASPDRVSESVLRFWEG